MARPRPTEVRAVAALLQEPAEDAEELAGRIIQALEDLRSDRPSWAVVVATGDGRLMYAYGPFGTQKQAETAVAKGKVPLIEGQRFGICKLWPERHAEKAVEAADEPVRMPELPPAHQKAVEESARRAKRRGRAA